MATLEAMMAIRYKTRITTYILSMLFKADIEIPEKNNSEKYIYVALIKESIDKRENTDNKAAPTTEVTLNKERRANRINPTSAYMVGFKE